MADDGFEDKSALWGEDDRGEAPPGPGNPRLVYEKEETGDGEGAHVNETAMDRLLREARTLLKEQKAQLQET